MAALRRRSTNKFSNNIWPGFVDAMTALLLVLIFVLSIFMIVQSMLRATVSNQENELDELGIEILSLSQALGIEQRRTNDLETQSLQLGSELDAARELEARQLAAIALLTSERNAARNEVAMQTARVESFEAQVASLLARNTDLNAAVARTEDELGQAEASIAALADAQAREISEKEALQLALATARDEIDESAEAARLAAAQSEVLEELVADLRAKAQASAAQVETLSEAAKSGAAQQQVLEALVAELRRDLEDAQGTLELANTETSGMQSQLSESERELAQTLTLLRASQSELDAARAQVDRLDADLSEADKARIIEVTAAEELRRRLANADAKLSDAEAQKLAEAAAAQELRARLASATTELTAMELNLEAQRKKAENTLTLLAAAQAAKKALEDVHGPVSTEDEERMTEREREAALLAKSNQLLSQERARAAEATRRLALLNEQTRDLRAQLNNLQGLLDASSERDAEAQVQIDALGRNLNAALAQVANEQRARADEQQRLAELEAAERQRLEEEAIDLRNYRSEFFGRVNAILGDREGVRVQGDRFVFSSEVLFAPGSADLGVGGRTQIARVAGVLREVAREIPREINWILRVDGHTDNVPVGGDSEFDSNWELSQARALSVVEYLIEAQEIPANRLAATGFGEFQPINTGNSDAARAGNRRIELKFTEK